MSKSRVPACAAAIMFLNVAVAKAESSTLRGEISIAQVRGMLDQAAVNATARQVMTAYLAGVGETAGVLMDLAKAKALAGRPACKRRLAIDEKLVQAALQPATGDPGETAATPLIVREMLKKADCEIGR
jgi:hypothetical protein